MGKGLLVIVGVLIFGFSAAKEATEESILRKRSCEQCKVDLGSSAGREMNKKGSSERCVCAEQETVIHRKVRSVDDGNITAANDGNKSDSETKGKNWITHRDCREYIKRKKQEYNGLPPKVETGDVNIDAMNATITKHGAHWMANVTWDPPNKNVDALENYLIYYSGASIPYFFCEEIPKNKTFKVINGSSNDWKYTEALDVLVVALPSSKIFAPALTARTFFQGRDIPEVPPYPKRSPTIKDKESTSGLTIILVATVLSCIVCALLGWIYRRRQRAQSIEEFETVQVKATKPQNTDKYFASYLPENEKFSNEVATIAYKLGTMGYKIVFDQVDSVHMNEIGFNMWVDKQILEAKKYIVFCSPGYVRLWQSLATSAVDNKLSHVNKEDLVRVRYEIKRISDVYSENCSTSRIVCVKMDPKMTTKQLPPWMNHNMLQWPEQKEDVIRRLNDQAAMVMHM